MSSQMLDERNTIESKIIGYIEKRTARMPTTITTTKTQLDLKLNIREEKNAQHTTATSLHIRVGEHEKKRCRVRASERMSEKKNLTFSVDKWLFCREVLLFYSFLSVIYIHFFIYEKWWMYFCAEYFHIYSDGTYYFAIQNVSQFFFTFSFISNPFTILNINVWRFFFSLYHGVGICSVQSDELEKKKAHSHTKALFKCIIVSGSPGDFNHNNNDNDYNSYDKKKYNVFVFNVIVDWYQPSNSSNFKREKIYLFINHFWVRVD